VHAPPPQLHAPLLYDPGADPGPELKRLNAALAAAHVELIRRAADKDDPVLCLLALTHTCSAVADGEVGYDERVHTIAVLIQNMQHLLSGLRGEQAADTLAVCFEAAAAEKRAAAAALRATAERAREAVAAARAAEAEAAAEP